MAFMLESPAFPNGGSIPRKYAREGANLSPPLRWKEAPPETRSFALIVEDPDAPSGVFRHWAIYNIDRQRDQLPEGTTRGAKTESLGHGVNDFGNAHYDGPQPPRGHGIHHYHFRLAALDVETLKLGEGARVDAVWARARPHIIAEAELIGTFESSQPNDR
ncbi:YbhB/YbcL family Raf kinase inhibitor-like protein [Phreatobacter stygius]|uniref:YbhB/YbcL family Raf kinase inhibitor-like protein n=1 Tax=Phreatobacter stygius TaxID=1940610 RepID=A0A4D7B6K6_9HYPH|nr:YbhB/YbcL family Raf kinase inhibitor-like protein [Phreatobacter stygius]QCI65850.1 YbhB/YbcL family Raf kinase inhibitor-like protein [Phreatobacter stygius]